MGNSSCMFATWKVFCSCKSLRSDLRGQGSGNVFASQLETDLALPIARLYRNDTGVCWQANYSKSSGYSTWTQTDIGPLGVSCSSVSSATWYTRARSLNSGATYTGAGEVASGYMGIIHMVHEAENDVVFGGELDGRTLRAWLLPGKPTLGEIYMVATSNLSETLVTSTETSIESKMFTSSTVDPSTVGGLTGSSANTLQSQLGSFTTLWSQSATVSMAESHGLVSHRCPALNTAAYIAIGCKTASESGFTFHPTTVENPLPSISLQRLTTTATDLHLVLVNVMAEAEYTAGIQTAVVVSLSCSCLAFLASLFLALILQPRFVDWTFAKFQVKIKPSHVDFSSTMLSILIAISGLIWLIGLSTEHRNATQDFSTQVTTSLKMMLGHQMVFSSSMVKQASSTWLHTGALTTHLSSLDSWSTTLLQDHHEGANISTLHFATSQGLQESSNISQTGMRVLSRTGTSVSDCVKTFLADGATSDSSDYPDQCNFDPRYTSWYQAGRTSTNDSTFSNTYNNSLLAAVTKACPGGDCSNGEIGVWAGEWQVSSISGALNVLRDGFEGSLAIIDSNGIVLATSSGITLEPAISCNDTYIKAASMELTDTFSKRRSPTTSTMVKESLIGIVQLNFTDFYFLTLQI